MEIDFLIIGQGLAGTALGYRLIKEGKSVMLFDQPDQNKSSRIAAGLYNPVTGRKMVKTWMGEILFPEIQPFYRELEELTGSSFLNSRKIYRPFLSIEEQNEWMGHSSDPDIQQFIEKIYTESQYPELKDPFGGVLLKMSGWLDINQLLDKMAEFFQDRLVKEEFEEEALNQESFGWNYRGVQAKKLIYCNGVAAQNSRFFSFLPFAPVKGEILEVVQSFNPEFIVNRGVFRVPLGNGTFRVGSTYTWHDLDQGPTETARKELLEKLTEVVKVEVNEVTSHKFGIRPATKDRKPFLGKHPTEESVYIFNGFGAKGVSLIPYFSQQMVEYLLDSKPLVKEVDIKRYFKYI
ncbi:FAD-binding oxidoreductase [Algoriphagus sp. AK58]|uniref:NAD(P)/FAD-dependent oxidoreductase n=1 Tax=Algoriphagus sp. AK58 TaxID=1406877 RepID=UPI00164F81A4|nr:FAD-dependent oxidoreductase [Algoriphagus sp. AK58]MBC6366635.1 amino acid oxidase [Algoriphagus sp. AK58]